MKRGYSYDYARNRLDTFADISAREVDRWPEGKAITVRDTVQRLVATQIATAATGIGPGDCLDDIAFLMDRIVSVRLVRRLPEIMLHTPRVRRARVRMDKLFVRVLAAHEAEPRFGQEAGHHVRPDFVDDLLEKHRDDPQFLPELDLKAACLGPFVIGLHTAASTIALTLYGLLKHPETLESARSEANVLFAGEGVTARKLRNLDVIHRVALETMRMHPIVAAVPREVVNSFDFAGHTIPCGTKCLIAVAVPHTLPEFCPEPERFDIGRFAADRLEHRAPGAWAPFGLGTHRCLGSGFFEIQSAITLATILNRLEISLTPPTYALKVRHAPAPRPDAGFRIKVERRPAG